MGEILAIAQTHRGNGQTLHYGQSYLYRWATLEHSHSAVAIKITMGHIVAMA
jgi:hypothetical protein